MYIKLLNEIRVCIGPWTNYVSKKSDFLFKTQRQFLMKTLDDRKQSILFLYPTSLRHLAKTLQPTESYFCLHDYRTTVKHLTVLLGKFVFN